MIDISMEELTGLYSLLSMYEERLDNTLQTLKDRIERKLYETLSIGEIEELVKKS